MADLDLNRLDPLAIELDGDRDHGLLGDQPDVHNQLPSVHVDGFFVGELDRDDQLFLILRFTHASSPLGY